jgi:hypothetical protein
MKGWWIIGTVSNRCNRNNGKWHEYGSIFSVDITPVRALAPTSALLYNPSLCLSRPTAPNEATRRMLKKSANSVLVSFRSSTHPQGTPRAFTRCRLLGTRGILAHQGSAVETSDLFEYPAEVFFCSATCAGHRNSSLPRSICRSMLEHGASIMMSPAPCLFVVSLLA